MTRLWKWLMMRRASPNRPWLYKEILGHDGPLTRDSPNWLGSLYNVKMRWEDDSVTWQPLNIIGKDDPLTC